MPKKKAGKAKAAPEPAKSKESKKTKETTQPAQTKRKKAKQAQADEAAKKQGAPKASKKEPTAKAKAKKDQSTSTKPSSAGEQASAPKRPKMATAPDAAAGKVTVEVVTPEKSPNDKNDYRLLVFSNGFEALLISSSDDKKNKAAAAVSAGVGSFSDPQGRCEGVAHYLEHMLFMGSEKYPDEAEMEDFLSKHGGYSNAFTEAAHTCYYIEINKTELHKGLDLLAQLFIHPLLKTDSAEREIHAIDSEFRLTQNSDSSRVEQLFASQAKEGHPFRTFGWGNLKSLQEATKKAGVDLNAELRTFYDKYYRAPRLRLCVFGIEPLDDLEKLVRTSFHGLPERAPEEDPKSLGPQEAMFAEVGAPFEAAKLPMLMRIRPVKDTHKLSMCWQLPPVQHLYKSKPDRYLAHLIGHEGAGSLLSFLKQAGFATRLCAGISEDSFGTNSMACLFDVEVTLTTAGLKSWPDVAHAVLLYMEMLRREGPQEWVYQEVVAVEQMGWKFLQEKNPTDQVQDIACSMLPVYQIDHKDILKAPYLVSEWNPDAISAMLKEMTADKALINVLSSAYGRAKVAEEPEDEEGEEEKAEGDDEEDECEEEEEEEESEEEEEHEGDECVDADGKKETVKDPTFSAEAEPLVEPNFGTEYWPAEKKELDELLARWKTQPTSGPLATAKTDLRLPDRNIYVATDFALRPKATKEAWEEERKPPVTLEVLRILYPTFPPFPNPLPGLPKRLPAATELGWRAWHWQDTLFETPRSEIWMKLSTDDIDQRDTKYTVLQSFLSLVYSDMLNETAYLAEQASLHVRGSSQHYGLDVYVGGFHHKLPLLLDTGLKELLSFGDPDVWKNRLEDPSITARWLSQREALLRGYRNAWLRPGDHAAELRRLLIMPQRHPPADKAEALEAVSLEDLAKFTQDLLPKLRAEVLISGNSTAEDAEVVVKGLPAAFREGDSAKAADSRPKQPKLPVSILQTKTPTVWFEDCPDAGNRNAALEMYWQLEHTSEHKPKVALDLLEALMCEPLFDTLRTKQQLGYVASCGMRHTQGVNGYSVWLLSSKVGPTEICKRVEAFLKDFRKRIVELPEEDLQRHVVALGGQKLEPERTLVSVQETFFSELQERQYCFDRYLHEAAATATLTRQDVLDVLDTYILPGAPKRRLAIVASIGGKAKSSLASELKAIKKAYPKCKVVSSQKEFLQSAKFYDTTA